MTTTPRATLDRPTHGIDALIRAKAGQRLAVCIPARDEAATVAAVASPVAALRNPPAPPSSPATAAAKGLHYAPRSQPPPLSSSYSSMPTSRHPSTRTYLRFAPHLRDASLQLVKPTYRRSLDGTRAPQLTALRDLRGCAEDVRSAGDRP